jgi:hypothetical protein
MLTRSLGGFVSRTFKRDRGFLTVAQNGEHDFLRLAYILGLSLKSSQKDAHLSVMVSPKMKVPKAYRDVFDEIIDIPWIDSASTSSKKIENDWKTYHITPYRETIRLDADMIVTQSIDHWWDILEGRDLTLCGNARNLRGEPLGISDTHGIIRKCGLPIVHPSIVHFRYSDTALAYFQLLETIFANYDRFSFEMMDDSRPKGINRDVCYAIAAKLSDDVGECFHHVGIPSFVSMKRDLQGWTSIPSERWTDDISMTVTPEGRLKIGNYIQSLPVNYDIKDAFTDDDIDLLKRAIA